MQGHFFRRRPSTIRQNFKQRMDAMKPEQKRVLIPVGDKDHTSGILSLLAKGHKRTAVMVAHGAGNDMNTPLIASFAYSLAVAGYPVLRSIFCTKSTGKKPRTNGHPGKDMGGCILICKGNVR